MGWGWGLDKYGSYAPLPDKYAMLFLHCSISFKTKSCISTLPFTKPFSSIAIRFVIGDNLFRMSGNESITSVWQDVGVGVMG